MNALRKILVVEEDLRVLKGFDRVLTKKGYKVISAHNAGEALERIRTAEADLVVTENKMAGMDGVALAERVHAARPWVPVLIVTGEETVTPERAKAAGVAKFLHKPVSAELIAASTEEALGETAPAAEVVVARVTVARELEAGAPARGSWLKDVALFIAAPFIGLLYVVFMPIVGLGMLAWIGGKALAGKVAGSKFGAGVALIAKMVAAPLVGLAFVIALPFVGFAALAWMAGRGLVGVFNAA